MDGVRIIIHVKSGNFAQIYHVQFECVHHGSVIKVFCIKMLIIVHDVYVGLEHRSCV